MMMMTRLLIIVVIILVIVIIKMLVVVSTVSGRKEILLLINGLSLCGSLAQCTLSLKRLSAGPGPGFNPQNRLNKLFQDCWRACFEIISRTGKTV